MAESLLTPQPDVTSDLRELGPACIDDVRDVPGQGPSCHLASGLWKVGLRSGRFILTHGPDALSMPFEALANGAQTDNGSAPQSSQPPAVPAEAMCVSDPGVQFHTELLYAYASDGTNRSATESNNYYAAWNQSNGYLRQATGLGNITDHVWLCQNGHALIRAVHLATPAASTTFATIVSDLQAAGYNSTFAKYSAWYDGNAPACNCSGQGNVSNDDTLTANNTNNFGPGYAVAYGTVVGGLANTILHEHLHTIGAVQLTAPNHTSLHHCTDGLELHVLQRRLTGECKL